jgi:adenylylsulfate kinase
MSWAIWITGKPGSGKTTLAERVAEELAAREIPVRLLNLESVRHVLFHRSPVSAAEQDIAHRALIYGAKLLSESGVAVIVDATAPRRAWREAARALIPRFAEVQLLCPTEICAERERAARWGLGAAEGARGRAAAAEAPDIALDYEESLRPELLIRTDVHDPWSAAEKVVYLAGRLHRMVPAADDEPERRAS